MTGIEIDFVVSDSLSALDLYNQIFGVEVIEKTALQNGVNEAIFSIYGTRFHMLDENPDHGLHAPKPGSLNPVWFNVFVDDIEATFSKAIAAGCAQAQAVTEVPGMGVKNALFVDPYGYLWMMHEITRMITFEERNQFLEEQMKGE